jgi:hypothetical protein
MDLNKDNYEQIKEKIEKEWPAWKVELVNKDLLVSVHSEKLFSKYNIKKMVKVSSVRDNVITIGDRFDIEFDNEKYAPYSFEYEGMVFVRELSEHAEMINGTKNGTFVCLDKNWCLSDKIINNLIIDLVRDKKFYSYYLEKNCMFITIFGGNKPDSFIVNGIKFNKIEESDISMGTYIGILSKRGI